MSLVLAGILPQTALSEGSPDEARDALKRFSPKAVSSDLSGGMILAAGLLAGEGGHILVVSDFNSWSGDDPSATRKILEADGRLSIVFADARQPGDNVALIQAWNVPGPGYVNHTALLHNYGPARSVPVTITGQGGETSRTVQMGAGEDYFLSTTAYPGITEISLDIDDAVSWDNRAYVYVPALNKKRVLYLGRDGPALAALRSLPNVEVATEGAPQGHDLVVVSGNATEEANLNQYIDGGRVIYIASGEARSPEYLPVRLEGVESGPASLWVRSEGFAEGLHFNEIGLFSYPKAASRRGSTIMVEANGQPILSYWRLGKGIVLYSGLELDSDFHLRPEYPIFWYKMVSWITDVPDTVQSNRKTGETVHLGQAAMIETPSTRFIASSVLLDQVGIYRYQGQTIAANMYDPKESSLQRSMEVEAGQFKEVSRETTVEKDLSHWVIALAVLAMLLELAVMRRRREA